MRDYLNINPVMLAIAPTHKCTAACENCCFACSPRNNHIMNISTMIKHIDDAINAYKTIRILIITGGECFVLGKDLVKIVNYATNKGLATRVVSNAFWATSFDEAINVLKPLVSSGLTEINLSTGDEHSKYVNVENIVNASLAAVQLNIKTVLISVESPNNANITSLYFKRHKKLYKLISDERIDCVDASWMYFKNNIKNDNMFVDKRIIAKPCDNIFNGIYINPYSQLLSCCGLTVEYNEYLKIGDLTKFNVSQLYERQFNDLFKVWLHIEGPMRIYEKIMREKGLEPKIFCHKCAYCIEIIRNRENYQIMKRIIKRELPQIIFNYKLENSKLKIC